MIAGAYPAAPPDQEPFLAHLAASPLVSGLELPFVDDEARWLPHLLPAHWANVVTAAPVTAIRGRTDPAYGLASTDETGRRAALAVTRALRDAVARSGLTVIAVELQSAPARTGDLDSFVRSLTEIAGWDWSGARLVIEHCDAHVPAHPPEKGFLSLDAELTAAAEVGMGVVVNWARSAIETRTVDGPTDHVAQAGERLAGVLFSGVAPTQVGDFPAWADAHLPPAPHEPASLLTADAIAATLAKSGDLEFTGVKVGARSGDRTPVDRAEGVLAALAMVDSSGKGGLEQPGVEEVRQ